MVPAITEFVRDFRLEDPFSTWLRHGYLQDVVENYVGLDISPTAARYYHKPFVQGSATELPFPDNDFDLAWTVWVLEHVPNPEQALLEMRRVVKDGGYLYLAPAWDCLASLGQGYPVRPFSDFDWRGKLTKAGMFALDLPPYHRAVQLAIRGALATRQGGGPTKLHYRELAANYDHYWMPDSDAINSLDRYEVSLWFTSRGDECLNCGERFLNEGRAGDRVPRAAPERALICRH
jgi:SAM-dependent methyltransferase